MARFRISTLLFICVIVSLSLAWFVDHRQLKLKINQLNRPKFINTLGEKHRYWSPSIYLKIDDISVLEQKLLPSGFTATGNIVPSTQGMGKAKLRRPTINTLDALAELLYEKETQLDAAKLLALYLQALSGKDRLLDEACLTVKAHFHLSYSQGIRWTLLADPDDEVRSAAALILGNTLPDMGTIESLQYAFDREKNDTVKKHIAWAIKTLQQPH